jgi:glycosyltransferase involved in cell wall biosynthesis
MLKVSIITVTLNCVDYLSDALLSVSKQDYSNLEIIVIDGGSTDGSLKILKDFNFIDILISEPDEGLYHALNKGIMKSSGDIVGFLHADDFFPQNSIVSDIVRVFNDHSHSDAVYGDLNYVSRKDISIIKRIWKSETFTPELLKKGWMPPHPTLYVRKDWYLKYGFFDTSFKISSDYDFIIKSFSNSSFKSVYLPSTIVNMRIGGESNKSIKNIFCKILEDFRIISKTSSSIFLAVYTLLFKNFSKVKQLFV